MQTALSPPADVSPLPPHTHPIARSPLGTAYPCGANVAAGPEALGSLCARTIASI